MSTVRFTAEVLPNGVIRVPDGVHLTPGKAEVTVATADVAMPEQTVRDFAGAFRTGDARSADNDRIDADLARGCGDSDSGAG
ncbi:MAG: hypothetical protein MI757_16565 [Pirellulales bacterium]|nr:hypothetical protein [Pirellulales bacterium]